MQPHQKKHVVDITASLTAFEMDQVLNGTASCRPQAL